MYRLEFKLNRRPSLWQRIVAIIATIAILALAFFLGLFVLIIILGLAFVAAITFAIRNWYIRHRGGRKPAADEPIEGRYIVIKRNRRK